MRGYFEEGSGMVLLQAASLLYFCAIEELHSFTIGLRF